MLSYPRIFISAGEHSGDRFGAYLGRAVREMRPDVRLSGLGGPLMADAGVRIVANTVGHAGMGLVNTFRHAGRWTSAFRRAVGEFNREPPDVIVPIDNPGFNLRLARLAQERRIPVCYYVSPQVWAWLPGRIHRIARLVTRMMVLLPFEKPLYDRLGVDCVYVGHPLLDYQAAAPLDEQFVAALGGPGGHAIGLLPGSRRQEVLHTFPIICDAASRIRASRSEIVFHVGAASENDLPAIREVLDSTGLEAEVHIGRTADIMKGSRLCLVASGTATIETAYYRTPMVVVYRTNRWARLPVRHLLRVPHICLVNIVAGREVVPEFLKFDDDAAPVAEAALTLLNDDGAWERCRSDLDEVMRALGPSGSCARAAAAVLDCMERHS